MTGTGRERFRIGLVGKIVIAMAVGVVAGLLLPTWGLRAVRTFECLFAGLLKFIVPLIVLALVTSAIAEAGRGAGRMLLLTVTIAYVSTLFAGFFGYGVGVTVMPLALPDGFSTTLSAAGAAGEPFFKIKVPPICDVMTALVLSVTVGLGIVFTGATALRRGFLELKEIVSKTVGGFFIPVLPWYIGAMICNLAGGGALGPLFKSFLAVSLVGCGACFAVFVIQFAVACALARRNPVPIVLNMLPTFLTAFGTCSSAATIPVALGSSRRNGVSDETVDLVIPLCATVHLAGSISKAVVCAAAVSIADGKGLPLAAYATFILATSVTAVAAPGVPGGFIMCAVGAMASVLGFTPEQCSFAMAVYLATDGFSSACNITGDGAVALIVDRFAGKGKDVRT